MFVITLYAKNAQDFRMMAFSKGFLAFFAKQALQCLNKCKFDFLTRSC